MRSKVKFKKRNNLPVFKIIGEFNSPHTTNFLKKIESLSGDDKKKVILDLSETTYIDSHGLGILIFSHNLMEKNQQELIFFINKNSFINEILEETNLSRIFRITNTMDT